MKYQKVPIIIKEVMGESRLDPKMLPQILLLIICVISQNMKRMNTIVIDNLKGKESLMNKKYSKINNHLKVPFTQLIISALISKSLERPIYLK